MLRRGWMRWAVVLGLLLSLLLRATQARAEEATPADKARLRSLLQAGAQAARAKKWQACIEALTAAAAIEDTRTTWGDLGLCEVEAGRFVDAHRHFRRALASATPTLMQTPQFIRYRLASQFAGQRISIVFVSTFPGDAFVLMDGRPLGKADGGDFDVAPGTHVFVARREGYEDASETRTMGPGDLPQVHLHMEPKPAPPAASNEHSTPAAPAGSGAVPSAAAPRLASPRVSFVPVSSGPELTPYTTAGGALMVGTAVALVGTVAALGLSIEAEASRSTLAKGLAPSACNAANASTPPSCTGLHDALSERNAAQATAIGFGAATAVLGGLLLGSLYAGRTPSRPVVSVVASDRGGGLVVSGAW